MSDFERFAYLIESNAWTYAKTMPKNPHFYTVRERWEHDDDFVFAVEYLRENGYDGYFWKRKYRYFDLNGYTYWTMGAEINNPDGSPLTIIINRKHRYEQREYSSVYDKIASEYESLFSSPDYHEETSRVVEITPKAGRVLDIGCGSGTLIDFAGGLIEPENYIGLDPSKEMLTMFSRKHSAFNGSLICDRFESFSLGKFDSIVCLFGSVSYVSPNALHRVEQMLNPGGRFFLMFYADDYEPVTHTALGIHPEIYRGSQRIFSGQVTRFGNYDIVTNYELLP